VPGAGRPCSQAVVLVGGEGTRLRPLTSRVPKPVVPVVDRPFVGYILDSLARHGVRHAVFSCGFLADAVRATIGDGAAYGVAVDYVVEDRPLGTAGAIKNVEDLLDDGRLLAFNGDVLTDVDLSAMDEAHRRAAGLATILLTRVEDPRRYGLVRLDGDGRITEFIEKPGPEFAGPGLINAGIYVLERRVLDLIPAGEPFSIERGVFPQLAAQGVLHGFVSDAYWRDIGTPGSYLEAHFDILSRSLSTKVGDELGESCLYVSPSASLADDARVVPPAYVGDDVTVGEGARVGPRAVVGPGSRLGAAAVVSESVVQDHVEIGAEAVIERSIVVRRVVVGPRTRVSRAVVGEACDVGADNVIADGCCLDPETVLPDGSVGFRDPEGVEGR